MAPQPVEVSARDRVLGRPELLELILCHLDMTTLLVMAQRVSTWWQSVISSSPALQMHLFYKPDERRRRAREATGQGFTPDDFNPLLVAKFGRFFFDPPGVRRTTMSFYADLPWATGVPMPTHIPPNTRSKSWAETVEDQRHAALRRFTRPGASWRRMLVAQPPPPPTMGHVRMEDNLYTPHVRVLNRPATPSPDGLRMGQLYDLVQAEAAGSRATSRNFRLLWSPQRYQMFGMDDALFQELMARTGVVLEVRHVSYRVCSPDPENLARLNDMFRCDECRLHPLLSEAIRAEGAEGGQPGALAQAQAQAH